jgi:hypothetical protein
VKQSPSWNEIVKAFAENPDVKFADVNLQGGGPRGTGSPGAGGWPTIRYYNKETGVQGRDYEKKTSMAMCSELGPEGGMLQQYIEEAGKTSLCSVAPPYKGCSEKEKAFIGKVLALSDDERSAQLNRLEAMKGSKMKDDLRLWLNQRIAILSKLAASPVEKVEL